ncbi:hypothetical protein AX15_005009 [Amanita polypyramis BW_CC]|nr:hypothetical protein AX15_005009 [Amanita polypyramis BW_CC]
MSHWGQFTGFPQQPQFQQPPLPNQPPFQQQQQQQQLPNGQFQQGYALGVAPLAAQSTGFTLQRPQGFQQPQQTGFQPPSGFLQSQPTGFIGGSFQQQHQPAPPPPPVPPLPTQIQQPNQSFNFLNAPPPQLSRFLTPSPSINTTGLAPQPTGFAPRSAVPLVPQVTGYVDPRLQLMSNSFMPMNTSAPYSAGGAPLLATQQQNLQQSFQQHNQVQRGTTGQQMSWALSKTEKKQYDQIFRSWDAQSTGFISGQTALEVFGASGLNKEDLARIWALADKDNRGMLNIAEFHVAMGLIYRRLNGMLIPDRLPPELVPPSARDLDSSVDMLKDLLKHESRSRSPLSLDTPVSRLKNRSFNSTSPSLETGRDATIYKHDDSEPLGGFYQPRSRHINRDDIRSRNEQGASADLTEMKRKLANTAEMLGRAAEAEASKTAEDEELEREMDDLKYRVQRVSDDLEYVSRGPRSAAKDEEKRRLERDLMSLMHERIPELERRIKARDEKREREKRQWTRDRDKTNERFGRYDPKDDSYSSPRYDDRDRPYSRGAYDRDGRDDKYGRDYDRTIPRRDRSRSRERERERERPRSPPSTRSPPPAPTASSRDPPAPASPKASPSLTSTKNMTSEERQAFAKAEARRRIEARMAALGITTPSATSLDTSVEERLQQEKKEAEEKALAAEKQAEVRERLRRERLESEKALREPKTPTVPSPSPIVPLAGATSTEPRTIPAPPASKPRAPAPPPPRRATAVNNVRSTPPTPPVKPLVTEQQPAPTAAPEANPEEEALRIREEALQKQREARAERIRQLEKEEEEAARREEEAYQARLQALKARTTVQTVQPVSVPQSGPPSVTDTSLVDTPGPAPVVPALTTTPSAPKTVVPPPTAEKSTNPFSRLINKDANVTATTAASSDSNLNPWARSMSSPVAPSPPKSPFPSAKPSYNMAPSSNTDDEWDEIKEIESDDDSSDDEIVKSRATRANIAQQLFGSMLPRPASGAAGSPATSPASPAPAATGGPPPPSAPPAPVPPPSTTAVPAPVARPGDVGALMQSIQGGTKLRPTKTVDKSGPSVSGRVLGDTAPSPHINPSVRPPSPPSSVQALPVPSSMVAEESAKVSNRQSVDWFADRAVDAGLSNSWVGVLPTTREEEEYEEKAPIPTVQVEQPNTQEDTNSLLSDIDKSIEYRARTLYPFAADGPDELSFGENLVLVANPSKSGGDWYYGTLLSTRKSGLFPKTFVQVIEPVTAKALYEYSSSSPDELSISAGDIISIIDRSDEEWWKAEQDGMIYIVPAAYVEIVEGKNPSSTSTAGFVVQPITASQGIEHAEFTGENVPSDVNNDDDCSDDSTSDYVSFESEGETGSIHSVEERRARERERQMVLEAAGLIVRPPPNKSSRPKGRVAPAVPGRRTVRQPDPYTKDLPPLPDAEPMDHTARLDDAYERFESFRKQQLSNNRLSVISTDSANLSSPTTSSASSFTTGTTRETESQGRYSNLLQFLNSLRTQEQEKKSVSILSISGPISGASVDAPWPGGPAFGSSWASLVDSSALEGVPVNERKRQEAIFELIITESAYVRDLQLIVEIFYATMIPILSEKETTVIFANVEDILLTNTAFLSSLEERQRECRLYVDKISDILHKHIPNMGVYMEYCVNQGTAAKVLQSLRETNHDLAQHLQLLRDSNPVVRNLDLSSYLLAPMQRITKYPLLIKQIQNYTEAEDEQGMIRKSLYTAEMLLDRINEAIREQEGQERLGLVSQNLWIGTGRLDLTAPTRYMGARKLLKEGLLIKAKSGRRLHGFLCSDILVLTDASMKTLYRLPIPLAHSQASVVSTSKNELTFQINQSYPRGGDNILLKTKPAGEGQAWVEDFNKASRRCHRAEERARKSRSYLT